MSHPLRLSLFAFAFVGTLAGIADDYSWTEGKASPRAFYGSYSDAEFASLKPAPEPLPILLDIWRTGPIEDKQFIVPALRVTRDAAVERQKMALNQPDPAFRSRIIGILADGASPSSAPILKDQLDEEDDARTRTDLLNALTHLSAEYPLDRLQQMMKAPLAAERAAALGLYLAQASSDRKVVWQMAGSDEALQVKLAALRALAKSPSASEYDQWLAITKKPPVLGAAQIAVSAILATKELTGQQLSGPAQVKNPLLPVAIAEFLPGTVSKSEAKQLIDTLLSHPHPSVQSAACLAAARIASGDQQAILIKYSKSPVGEVRRAAAEALANHPTQATMNALVACCGDEKSVLVRKQARTSLEAISKSFPVAEQLPKLVNDASELRREQLFTLSANINAKTAGPELAGRLDKEPNPANLAALVRAVSMANHAPSKDAVFALADHESPAVRASVAFAVAHLPIPAERAKLSDYVQNDMVKTVRTSAFQAMAHIGNDEFDDAILAVLLRTNYAKPEFLTADDRALAAWVASRSPSLPKPLVERMIKQVTHKVIKTALGPSHDSNSARYSCAFALTEHLRKSPDNKSLKSAVKEVLGMLTSESPINDAPTDSVSAHYGRQIQAWLDGTPIDRSYPRLLRYRMLFEPLQKDRPKALELGDTE